MPPKAEQPAYAKDEKVLCFHGELLYEAKVLDSKPSPSDDKKNTFMYRVHYKGWKNTWDDWVHADRVRKLTEENKELAQNLKKDFDAARRPPPKQATGTKRGKGSDQSSNRASEERHSSVPATGRGQKRGRDYELDREESFHTRPAVRIHTPDAIKAILVDDWEYVTKNGLLVKIPHKLPANKVLDEYHEEEKPKRRVGSAEADILEEVISGLKEYFHQCLGRILLYKYERQQYLEARKLYVNNNSPEWEGKGPGDVYGAEHLARLIVSMPELIAQTNMDHQAIARLREEMTKLNQWLAKNSARLFIAEYEQPSMDYIEKAKGVSN